MVAQLLSLRWQVYLGTLRRSVWQTIGAVVAMLYALSLGGLLAVAGLVGGLRSDLSAEVVVGGAILVLVWTVGPLVAFGLDDTFDPRRLAPFPLSRRDLMVGTSVATLLGPGGIFTVVAALGLVLAWVTEPAALLAALVGVPLGLATAVLGGRATTTAARPLVEGRRGRDLAVIVAVLLVSVVTPAILLVDSISITPETVAGIAAWASWTPFGAAFALPADVAAGAWAALGGHLVIALATPALLVLWWRRSLTTQLTRPARASAGHGKGLGVLGRVPDSPVGAVLARCLTYWVRDPRYATSLISVPVLVVIVAVLAGDGPWLLVAGPLVAWTCGWAISVDIALDSTAFWTHVAAPMRWTDDRWGRVIAIGVPGALLTLVTTLWTLSRADRWDMAPALLGVGAATLLASLGLASLVSALVVFPVNQPGDNPFGAKQGGSMGMMLSQMLGTLALAVALAPAAVLTVLAIVRGSVALGWAAAVVGNALGVVVLLVGVRLGARRLDARAPELLTRLASF